MAHKKAGGSTKNGRDSHSKRLGIKCYGNQLVYPGYIILKQRGTKFYAGKNVKCGRDYTLYATKKGKIKFETKGIRKRKFISII